MNIHKGVGTMLYEFFNQSFIIRSSYQYNVRQTYLVPNLSIKNTETSVIEISNQLHPPDLLTARKKAGIDWSGWAPFLAVPAT